MIGIRLALLLLVGYSSFAAAQTRGQAAWSLGDKGNVLEPLRAVVVDKVRYQPDPKGKVSEFAMIDMTNHLRAMHKLPEPEPDPERVVPGYVYPTRPTDHLIVVYFLLHSDKVSVKDTDWVIRGHDGKEYNPIGIGCRCGTGGVSMLGQLTSGDLILTQYSKQSLLALLFVIPTSEVRARLRDPQKHHDHLVLSEGWNPGFIYGIPGAKWSTGWRKTTDQ